MPLAMLLSAQLVVAGLLLLLCGFPFCVAAASSRLLQKYGRIAQGLELPFKPERNPRATERGVVLGASCFRAACVTGTFPALVLACSAACHGRNCPTPCSCSQPSASSGLLPRSCPKARPFAPPASLAGECGSPAITCSKLRSHTPAAPTAPQIPSARACAWVTPPPPPLQDAGGQCFAPSQDPLYSSMYKYKATQCGDGSSAGITALNPQYDSAAASKCKPLMGQASCAGCTSVSGCMWSSRMAYGPGRGSQGTCESASESGGSEQYVTRAS